MAGWIKLHRCLLGKPIWACATPVQRNILISILLLANHAEREWEWKGQRYKCSPGQLITSSDSLAKKVKCSRQNIRTALKRFEKYEFLTSEPTSTGILVTVNNWERYQCEDSEPNQPTNQRLTNDQPTLNQRLTTNKNDKRMIKNVKKNIYIDFVKLTDEEHAKLIDLFGEEGTHQRIQNLNDYLGAKGDKYKSHYHTLMMWERKNKENPTPPKDKPRPSDYETFIPDGKRVIITD